MTASIKDLAAGAEWLEGLLDDYECDNQEIRNCIAFLDAEIQARREGKRGAA